MLRSMYSGISGMKAFQTKLDVVGNNIANVNTFAFKKGRVTFQDLMSQTIQGAQGPQGAVSGGKNPMQVGLGVTTGSIDTIDTQGNQQTTNRPLDLALEGDGMFAVANGINDDGTVTLGTTEISFTRAGNFYLDNDGNIVNSDGSFLVGLQADASGAIGTELGILTIPKNAQSFSISSNGEVNIVDASGNPQVVGQIQLAKFSNPGGLEKVGSNNYKLTNNAGALDIPVVDSDGDGVLDTGDGIFDLVPPGSQGTASIYAGALEMSNVDLAEEFTEMITAQRGFQANTRIITTSDEILQELVNLKR